MRRFSTLVALTAVGFAGLSGVASAQEDGVTIDGDAPAAKEYALPHEEARREAAGGSTAQLGARDSAKFGEGLGDESAAGGAAASVSIRPNPADAGKRAATAARSADAAQAAAAAATAKQLAAAGVEDDGPSGTAVLIGGGALALIAVLVGGFGLRAVRRHDLDA